VISRKQDAGWRGSGGTALGRRHSDECDEVVIAADGGSSPPASLWGLVYEGRTYEDRWIVIDAKVKKPWPDIDKLRFHCDPGPPDGRLPNAAGHHRWEFPVLQGDDEKELVTEAAVLKCCHACTSPEHVDILRAVTYSHHVRSPPSGASDASSWRAMLPTRCHRGSARECRRAFVTH